MRGTDERHGSLLSYFDLEDRIPAQHPLRKILQVVTDVLASLDKEFDDIFVSFGRLSIALERVIRANRIQIRFSIWTECQVMEKINARLGRPRPISSHCRHPAR